MTAKINLALLRDIGWSLWDPIGLIDDIEDCIDEYDNYLIKVAEMIKNKKPTEEATNYLVYIETEHMGLTLKPDTHTRAEKVVKAISEAKNLWSK